MRLPAIFASGSTGRGGSRRAGTVRGLKLACALALLFFAAAGARALAQDAPVSPAPGSAGQEDFGQYLADHASNLGPFFTKNNSNFVSQGVPVFLEWLGGIMLATMIAGWVLDVALSRGFSALFAPAAAQLSRAFVYATGRLALSVVVAVLFGVAVIVAAKLPGLGVMFPLLAVLFLLLAAAAQVGWIHYLYRTDIFISLLFYVTLVVIHGFAALAISAPMAAGHASGPARAFVDGTITPRLEAEAAATKRELAAATATRDEAATAAARLTGQIDQDKAEAVQMTQEIEAQKVSAGYLFSQIVKVHARGDLADAQARLTDFLKQFPDGPLTGLAKGQLVQVQSELAAQAAQKKQAEADAARAAAQARADLLARAARGEATLSQMRNALIGKTRAEVAALLGPPAETASDRWGFSQQMILNPLTNEKSGLGVYFNEGIVQGVDYYYGNGGAR